MALFNYDYAHIFLHPYVNVYVNDATYGVIIHGHASILDAHHVIHQNVGLSLYKDYNPIQKRM
jgi:hypothetical protein